MSLVSISAISFTGLICIFDLSGEKHSHSNNSLYAILASIFFNLEYSPIEKPLKPQREQLYLLLSEFKVNVATLVFLLYPTKRTNGFYLYTSCFCYF